MNRVFKLVGRYSDRRPVWMTFGKCGTQAKKRVYTTLADFERYAPDTARMWLDFCKYDVEAYEQRNGKWWEIPSWCEDMTTPPEQPVSLPDGLSG